VTLMFVRRISNKPMTACLISVVAATESASGQACFSERPITVTADGAVSVAVADIDGDGLPDLVLASFNDDTIRWLKNDGGLPPTFVELPPLSTSIGGPRSIAVADIEGDGDVDVFVAAALDDQVLWFENLGGATPTFASPVPLPSEDPIDFARSLAIHDINGDGALDVLCASSLDGRIRLFLQDGAAEPSFIEHVIFSGFAGASSVVAANIDDDPHVDVVAILGSTVLWFRNDGAAAPAFAVEVVSPSAPGAISVFAEDLNRDGQADVIVGSENDSAIRWFRNDGGPSPTFDERLISDRADGQSVHACDVDGDEDIDVLCTGLDNALRWFENTGEETPSFIEHLISTNVSNGRSVIAADLDLDGDLDVAAASSGSDTATWFEHVDVLNATTDARTAQLDLAVAVASDGDTLIADPAHFGLDCAAVLDFLDLAIDIMSSSELSRPFGTRTTLSEQGRLMASTGRKVRIEGTLTIPAKADSTIVGDSITLAGPVSIGAGAILRMQGDAEVVGAPLFRERLLTGEALGATAVHAADVDGDGDLDVLAGSTFDDTVRWFEAPTFEERIIAVDVDAVEDVYAADLGGDGQPTIIAAAANDDAIRLFDYNPAVEPPFDSREIADAGNSVRSVIAARIDADEHLDLVSSSAFDDRIRWHRSDGAPVPSFETFLLSDARPDEPLSVFTTDLDADGDIDVLTAANNDDAILWLQNAGNPDPTFVAFDITTLAMGATAVHAADLDGDGDQDVLSVSFDDSGIRWHENDGSLTPGFATHDLFVPSAEDAGSTIGPIDVFPIDLDDDADIDVLAATFNDDSIRWYENDGGSPPSFVERMITSRADGAKSVFAVDLDADGDVDILAASRNDNSIRIFENAAASTLSLAESSTIETLGAFTLSNRVVEVPPLAELASGVCFSLNKGGVVTGGGLIRAPLVRSSGLIAPSSSDVFSVSGDYQQFFDDGVSGPRAGALAVDLTDGSEWSRLDVTGAAELAGALRVEAGPEFDPAVGERFEVLTAASLEGSRFDVAFLPGLDRGRFLRVEYQDGGGLRGSGSVTLVVDTILSRGVDLEDPESTTVTGLPSTAVLADIAGVDQQGALTSADGQPDLALAIPAENTPSVNPGAVVVLVNGGVESGVWQGFSGGTVQVSVGPNPSALAAGDMDEDKDLDDDLLLATVGDRALTALLNMGGGTLTPAASAALSFDPADLVLRDFDRDAGGRLDIAVVGSDPQDGGFLASLLNAGGMGPGWNGFESPATTPLGLDPTVLAAGDMDEDKDLDEDLAVADGGNASVHIVENLGGGTGQQWQGFIAMGQVAVGAAPVDIALRDLDLDGDLDFVTADRNGDTISISLAGPGLAFNPSASLPVGDRPRSIAVADLDSDGDADLGVVVDADEGSTTERTLRILRNDLDGPGGQLAFAPATDVETTTDPLLVLAGDVDGRAGEDLVAVGEATESGLRGAARMGEASTILVESCPADLDGDGQVNASDLGLLLKAWGDGGADSDLNGDTAVNSRDLSLLLGSWGPCS